MTGHIRKSVIFNLDDAHQRSMYEWCMSQSSNFSGFVKDLLFAQKSGNRAETAPVIMDSPPIVAAPSVVKSGKILGIL